MTNSQTEADPCRPALSPQVANHARPDQKSWHSADFLPGIPTPNLSLFYQKQPHLRCKSTAIMGIRKHSNTPKTPQKSAHQKRRQLSNLGSPSACRKPRSPHTPTKTSKNARDHLPVPDTVTRAKIQGAREFALANDIPHDPKDIFAQFGVKNRTGYRYLHESARTGQGGVKQRGRKPKLSGSNVVAADSLLEDSSLGMEAKGMQWHALTWELDLPVAPITLRRTLNKALNYGKYDADIKEALSERTKHDRYVWANNALAIRPTIEHWKNVRFSDEMHAKFGPEGRLKIIRKREKAMRGRFDNIQHQHKPTDNQAIGKVHVWAAIGWDFKSPMIYYEVKNPQGSITHKAYIEQILEVEVIKWIQRGDVFVLEQDGASRHGGGPKARKNNPVAVWLRNHHVDSYFNCHDSPDFAPIETCWQPPKSFQRKRPHWDKQTLRELLEEGWTHVTQDYINYLVSTMPQRLEDAKKLNGDRTSW